MAIQFRLRTMFLVAAVIGTSLGAFGLYGLPVAVMALGTIGAIRLSRAEWRWVPLLLALAGLMGLCMMGPPMEPRGIGSRPGKCVNNLKQIALALHNYHDDHGCFPPAYVADANGRPMHSWRVLILPYLEQKVLYDQYDFTEPWNGPNNSKLLATPPDTYGCPSDDRTCGVTGAWPTSYLAVVGAETALEATLTATGGEPASTLWDELWFGQSAEARGQLRATVLRRFVSAVALFVSVGCLAWLTRPPRPVEHRASSQNGPHLGR
jgi:hypothetical protein